MIVNRVPCDTCAAFQVNYEADRLRFPHLGKEVGHYLVLVIERSLIFDDVNYQVVSAFKAIEQMQAIPLANGETKTWQSWRIEAIPAYNLKRGPAPGKLFHDKGRGNWLCPHLRRQAVLFFRR